MAKAAQVGGILVEVEGLKQLQRALNHAARQMDDPTLAKGIANVHHEVGSLVAARARQICPKRTGRLAASIKVGRQKAGAVVKAGGARVSHRMVRVKKANGDWSLPIDVGRVRSKHAETRDAGRVFYAPLVHAKDPFLVKAAQQTRPVWMHQYLNGLQQVARTIGMESWHG